MFGEKFKRTYALTDAGVANAKKGTVWTVVVNLVDFAGIAFPFLFVIQLVDCLTQGSPYPELLPYAGGVAVFLILSFLAHLKQYDATYNVVYDQVAATRLSLAERLRKLPLSFFGKRDLAELTETIIGDVTRLEHVWSHVLGYLYGSYISTAIAAVCLAFCDWRLTIAAFWGVPVAFALLFGSRKKLTSGATASRNVALKVSDSIQETLENIREIRATNQEERYLADIKAQIDHAEKVTAKQELTNGIFVNAASIIMRLGIASTVLVGALLIASGQVSFITFFMFLVVVTRIYVPFDQSLALIAEVFFSETAVKRLQGIYDAEEAGGRDTFEPKGYDITFENVRFAYDESAENAAANSTNTGSANTPTVSATVDGAAAAGETAGSNTTNADTQNMVLNGVSFTAEEGQVTALVGPSGSGKSTCAKLAARLWDANSGTIKVGGEDIASIDPETLLASYSMVFQDVTLFDDTIMSNIRLGKRNATDEEVLAAAKAANCDEFVSRLPQGYDTLIGENGARLSGGERQRISIARALLKDAPILLLDEATASLDVENENEVQQALSHLVGEKTVLVIAHRMRTVENADKIVVLDGGRVVEQGSPQDLLQNEKSLFKHMHDLQTASNSWTL